MPSGASAAEQHIQSTPDNYEAVSILTAVGIGMLARSKGSFGFLEDLDECTGIVDVPECAKGMTRWH